MNFQPKIETFLLLSYKLSKEKQNIFEKNSTH